MIVGRFPFQTILFQGVKVVFNNTQGFKRFVPGYRGNFNGESVRNRKKFTCVYLIIGFMNRIERRDPRSWSIFTIVKASRLTTLSRFFFSLDLGGDPQALYLYLFQITVLCMWIFLFIVLFFFPQSSASRWPWAWICMAEVPAQIGIQKPRRSLSCIDEDRYLQPET